MPKRGLGRGIDALLQGRPLDQLQQLSSILMIAVDDISPNPNQPRKRFDDDSLAELADSIRERGIIQPIIAEDRGDGTYVIVAGERRYRAARLAGLTEVPVISRDLTEEEMLEIALIENIQREDLNPIDEAMALQSAIDHSGVTQDQLAKRLGKSRSAIANTLRLLRLDEKMRAALSDGRLTSGHARALLALGDEADRRLLFDRILAEGLSVREAELLVKGGRYDPTALDRAAAPGGDASPGGGVGGGGSSGAAVDIPAEAGDELALPDDAVGARTASSGRPTDSTSATDGASTKSIELKGIEESLIDHLRTRVVVRGSDTAGKIEINYVSPEDLVRIVESMGARVPE